MSLNIKFSYLAENSKFSRSNSFFSILTPIFLRDGFLNSCFQNPSENSELYCFSADPVSVASCLHSFSLMNGWIMAKLTQIYHWVGEKGWLDFDDLDLIFKVTQGLKLLEKAGKLLVCTLSPEGINGFWPYLHI